ncbi:MAG TPA: hypothetical protein VN901_10705 [Candidatus Acidoferrales bacterium]|nr:hypothetical protein [Candidatus Acidoferrales bacterium]
MRWLKWILAYLFDCIHRHTTWPHRDRRGLDYICCLDCGKELPYSMRRMSIVSKEEQLEDQSRQGWKKLSSAGGRAGARRERLLPPGDAFAGTG